MKKTRGNPLWNTETLDVDLIQLKQLMNPNIDDTNVEILPVESKSILKNTKVRQVAIEQKSIIQARAPSIVISVQSQMIPVENLDDKKCDENDPITINSSDSVICLNDLMSLDISAVLNESYSKTQPKQPANYLKLQRSFSPSISIVSQDCIPKEIVDQFMSDNYSIGSAQSINSISQSFNLFKITNPTKQKEQTITFYGNQQHMKKYQ